MGQNLYSRASNGSLLSVGDIHSFLDDANSLVKPVNEMASSLLRQRIQELETMIGACRGRENDFYKKFECSNIKQLQLKIDTIMGELGQFSNRALRAMPLVQQMQKDTNSLANLSRQLEIEINRFADSNPVIQQANKDQAEALIAEHLAKILGSLPNGPSPEEIRRGIETKQRRSYKGKYRIKKEAFKNYKKEMEILFDGHSSVEGTRFDLTIPYDETALMNDNPSVLTAYPYYKLTPEERLAAEQNETLWMAFVNKISAMAGKYSNIAKRVMTTSGLIYKSDFFINSNNELIGVLGELQVLIVFQALTNDIPEQSFIDYLGNAMKGGKKISIDVLVGGEGIQVKNYNTYGIKNVNEGFNLTKTVSLDYFLSLLASRAGGELQTLADFYTIRAYHTQVTDQFAPTLSRLQVFDTRVKDYFQAYVSELLPMNTVEGAMREGRQIATASNLFFFVSGRLVPISKILLSYKKYMQLLLEQMVGGVRRTLTVTPLFSNSETYANYWTAKAQGEGEKYKDSFTYDNIYNSISIRYNININIDYVLEEILFREDG